MKNKPIKHHSIPQFILKNFCFENQKLFFYSKKTNKTSIKTTQEVFMKPFLYQDSINHPDEEMKIETDLAKFESEVAKIFKKFLKENEICISIEDYEMLKLFVAIMRLRSKTSSDFFKGKLSEQSKNFYLKYQPDGNFDDFWKRNLGNIVKCRSLREVEKSKYIDEPFKIFMKRDSFGICDMHFVIGEKRGKTDFILSDSYPTVIYEQFDKDNTHYELPMYDFLPISPNRNLLFISNHIETIPTYVKHFDDDLLKPTKSSINENIIRIPVRKIYEDDVNYINLELIKNNEEGFVFKNKDKIGNIINQITN